MVSQIELEKSISFQKFMSDEGLVASPEEVLRRRNVVAKLKEIVMMWIIRVAYQRGLPKNQIKAASATILPYGSYGLGVYDAESNIDALCVVPCFASVAEDFFIVLQNILAGRPEVSGIHCVKDAEIPFLRFTLEGILIDLFFTKLNIISVPENVDVFNPPFINGIDEASRKSLSLMRENNTILQIVSDVEKFRELLRCVKSWAKRRGVYGNLFGYFGGIHLAVLAVFICQKNPNENLVDLISIFFKTFALWPWPEPVILQEGAALPPEKRAWMPIQLPSSPNEYCYSNMTTSTFNKIRAEFRRGYRYSQDPFKPQWKHLFEPFPYARNYLRFIKICLSTNNNEELGNWVDRVKSHIRSLLVKLEKLQALCDPNPTEYIDLSIRVPNVVFYWGILPGRADNLDLNTINENFLNYMIIKNGANLGRMTLTMVQVSQLPKILQLANDHIKGKLGSLNEKRIPLYSKHSPWYLVGYLATDGDFAHL